MPRKVYLVFSLLVLAAGSYHLVSWPITGTDTDLWYHLNGGRYLFETGSIARTSFFSFIEPPRVWVNYYWLFQVLVYQIFSWSGYTGLISFRALLSCATLLMIFFYLYKDQKERDTLLYYTLLFVFYVLLFLPRSLPVRPHLFSYLLIIIFLYVLEFKPLKGRWLLPPLVALWVNLHGVEYPVMLLILGAYFAEFVCERIKERGRPRGKTYLYAGILVLSAAAVLCTPHGVGLLAVSFKSMAQVSPFVYELRPLSIHDFISFFGILFLLAGFAAIAALKGRRMRISHLLLFLGGLVLLLKAKRFVNEYALLVLPLLKAYIPIIPTAPRVPRAKMPKLVATVLIVAFMAMPFFFMHSFFADPPRYPLSARELPEGVALFLKRVNGTGSVLNYPDAGGYLEWELFPKYKIFMDMQVPFLFTADDFRTVRAAYADPRMLREVIARYQPAFITAPIEMEGFRGLIADHQQYRLIFFDDAEVLYVDGTREPALASQYEIKSIDPFSLYVATGNSNLQDPQVSKELLKLSTIYPDVGIVNAAIATIYQSRGSYREAMPYAESIIRTYPESYLGYRLKAILLSRLGGCGQAMSLYKKAIQRSDGAMKKLIEMEASACKGR